jgi:dihydrofolate reductase
MGMSELIGNVAYDDNRIIGDTKTNKIPWHIPSDLKLFRQLTMGKPVIMGRKTWESLDNPLDGRTNIVVSNTIRRTKAVSCPYVLVRSVNEAISIAFSIDNQAHIIGGLQIYKEAMDHIRVWYITHVFGIHEGDIHFPLLQGKWTTTEIGIAEGSIPNCRHFMLTRGDRL